jgi:hypothetical protein
LLSTFLFSILAFHKRSKNHQRLPINCNSNAGVQRMQVVSSDDDNDGEFKPGVQKRKTRGKGQRKQQKFEESIDSEEEFVQQLEEDNEPLVWSSVSGSSSEVDLDNDGDEYHPAGRNAKRAMARSCSTCTLSSYMLATFVQSTLHIIPSDDAC